MSVFSKAKKYSKSSLELEEKIKLLENEEKKNIEEGMTTDKMYSIVEPIPEVPPVPPVMTDVPDPNGVRTAGYVQPDGGFDENDPSTWDNAFQDTSWMYNSNEVMGETGRPVVSSVDTTWANVGGGAFQGAGLVRTHIYYGDSLGYLGDGGIYQGLLTASYWGHMVPPHDSQFGSAMSGAHYYGIGEAKKNAMQSAYAQMLALDAAGTPTIPIKMWVPWSYFWYGGTYESYSGPKQNGYILKNASLYAGAPQYESEPFKPHIPAWNKVIQQKALGDGNDPENFPGIIDAMGLLFGKSKQAIDAMLERAGFGVNETTANKVDNALRMVQNLLGATSPLSKVVADLPVFDYSREIAASMIANEPVTRGDEDVSNQAKQNYIKGIPDAIFQQIPINSSEQSYSDDNIYVDDNGTTHSNIGPNGEKGYYVSNKTEQVSGGVGASVSLGYSNELAVRGKSQNQIVMGEDGNPVFIMTDHAYINNASEDKDEIPSTLESIGINPKQTASDAIHQVLDKAHGREGGKKNEHGSTIGTDTTTPNTGAMSGYDPNIRGDSVLRITIPFAQWTPQQKKLYKSGKMDLQDKGTHKEEVSYDFDKDPLVKKSDAFGNKESEKDWFNPTDLKPEYPKKKSAELKNGWHQDSVHHKKSERAEKIKVKSQDMIRHYRVSKQDIERYHATVDAINNFIDNRPLEVQYISERYPAHDTRLAELNWKLDKMMEASADYVKSKFPENKKVTSRIVKIMKKNIELTDPKSFKKDPTPPTHSDYIQLRLREAATKHFRKPVQFKSWHKGHLT